MTRIERLVPVLAALALLTACAEDPAVEAGLCGGCDPRAKCVKPEGQSPQCRCNAGFAGDGKSCYEVASPTDCIGCHERAQCVRDAAGATFCQCQQGFVGNGETCEAVLQPDSCGGCAAEARCLRDAGGNPVCVCNSGFYGDGQSCTLSTSCDDNNGACHRWASCEMGENGPRCTCAYGLSGTGYACNPPPNAPLRLRGRIGAKIATNGNGCVNTKNELTWAFDLPLVKGTGAVYAGTATTGVFKITGEAEIVDAFAGTLRVKLDIDTWSTDTACIGRIDFKFSTDSGALTGGQNATVGLSYLGSDEQLYFKGTFQPGMAAVSTTTLSGELSASFAP